jgi:hypothetical protein
MRTVRKREVGKRMLAFLTGIANRRAYREAKHEVIRMLRFSSGIGDGVARLREMLVLATHGIFW